jgi:hypothetical protein
VNSQPAADGSTCGVITTARMVRDRRPRLASRGRAGRFVVGLTPAEQWPGCQVAGRMSIDAGQRHPGQGLPGHIDNDAIRDAMGKRVALSGARTDPPC